jgi:tetratricopeptide (TPR) repeat protein
VIQDNGETIRRFLADRDFSVAQELAMRAVREGLASPETYRLLAAALIGLHDISGALQTLEMATVMFPMDASVLTSLGDLCLSHIGDIRRAEQQFARAIGLRPNDPDNYLGYVECHIKINGVMDPFAVVPTQALPGLLLEARIAQLRNLGLYSEARGLALHTLKSAGRRPSAFLSLARMADEEQHSFVEARRYVSKALQIAPGSGPGHLAYLALLIKEGRWADACGYVNATKSRLGNSDPYTPSLPSLWSGDAVYGKTVLLHSTLASGYGDFIQFSRFAAVLREQGARVGVRTRKPLKSLLSGIKGVDFVISIAEDVVDVDYTADMSLIWMILNLGMDDVALDSPYLCVGSTAPLGKLENKSVHRVGLILRSADRNPTNKYTAKCISLEHLVPLQAVSNAHFYSFEVPPIVPCVQETLNKNTVTVISADFDHTAAILAKMDVVITVDTAMAHLSGALGKKTFLLLPYSPDWRWMLNRKSTPWYPSMDIIRQPRPGDWLSVIRQCVAALAIHCG